MKHNFHGLTYEQAEDKMFSIVESANKDEIVEIITGNSEQMKKVVINILKRYDIKPYPELDNAIVKFSV